MTTGSNGNSAAGWMEWDQASDYFDRAVLSAYRGDA